MTGTDSASGPNIETSVALEEWLKDKPVAWAQAIAVRAALRVFPLAFTVFDVSDERLQPDRKLYFTLHVFRANFICWVACRYPDREFLISGFADVAAKIADDLAEVQGAPAARSAAYAATSAVRLMRSFIEAQRDNANSYMSGTVRSAVHASAMGILTVRRDKAYEDNDAIRVARKFWSKIEIDARWLAANEMKPHDLILQPLWLIDVNDDSKFRASFPLWAREPFDAFVKNEHVAEGPWKPIVDWYRMVLPDDSKRPPASAFGRDVDIAIATQPKAFWERDPDEVMEDIGRIVDGEAPLFVSEKLEATETPDPTSVLPEGNGEADVWTASGFDFFLSYTEADLAVARRISNTLEAAGFTVFSQFNDMTAGKSFVREMNRGLRGMARMIAVYSDEYFASGPCMSEWEAAYLTDPSGEKGKIVPFMVKPCAPSPLAKRLVWTSLLGLSPEEERRAILNSVLGTRTPRERAAQRQAMKAAASPDVSTDASGDRLDAMVNETVDAPFADIDLAHLPEMLRSLIQTALASIEGKNCSAGFRAALKAYSEELAARGTTCIPGVLRGQMDYIEAELDDPDANHWVSGKALEKTLENIRQAHARLIAHYPLDQERERLLRAIAVEPAKYEPEASQELRREVLNATREAYDAELVTDDYKRVVENRARVARDILDLRAPEPPFGGDEDFRLREVDRARRLQDAKKRTLAQQAGFADKSLEVLGKITRLADSPSAQRLAKALQDFADWFW